MRRQAGHGRAQQDLGGVLLLGLDVHPRRLQDVTRLVGPLLGLADEEDPDRHGHPDDRQGQGPAPVVGRRRDIAHEQDPDGLGHGVVHVVPREDARSAVGGIGVGQIGVVDGVARAQADGGDQIEEDERPHVVHEGHERDRDREDEKGDGGHVLAAAAVGEHRHRHPPADLGHGADEDHRPQPGVAQVEGAFDLRPQDPDAVHNGVGDHGRHREQDQGREAVLAQDADQGGRLALARAGHEGHVGDGRLVPALADRGGEQLVGDHEIEQGLFPLEHRLFPHKRVAHSCATLIPDAFVRDFGRLGRSIRGTGIRSPGPPRSSPMDPLRAPHS